MAEVRVRAVGVEAGSGRPVVLLEEATGRGRIVPVSVGETEAAAVAGALGGLSGERPDTHQLVLNVLAAFGRRVRRVRVHTLRDQVFHAELVLDDDTTIDSRTSDAVIIALRAEADVEVGPAVLDAAGVDARTVRVEGGEAEGAEVEEFRRFLDSASPEDFDPGRTEE
ncbi:bifunctional nuclease family protein [Pseudonocardia nantongensis]|uniref:bifunctional nuclease family protein n=1 Tax=Pseudonocardia nantongensis TaxID=1181885 RepID=UPI00397920DD